MPTAVGYHGTTPAAHAAHPFSLHWAAQELVDVTGARGIVVPLDTVTISEVGANGASSMSFLCHDAKRILSLPALGRVQLTHNTPNEVLFAGYVMGRQTVPWQGAGGYSIQTNCTDYSYLLDTTMVPALRHKAGGSDRALIQSVVGHSMRHPTIYTHTSFCTSTNSSMPAMDFSHITLRAAIESIQAAAGEARHYYVDFLGRLHYYQGAVESAMGTAPYVITDAPGGAERAATGLSVEYDDSQIINAVYIFGGSAKGSGWEKDEASIKLYGLRQGSFAAAHCMTAAHRANVGRHFLGLHKDPIVRGSFTSTTSDTGWRVGQALHITSSQLGLSNAIYPIVQIDTTFVTGAGMRNRTIYFGDLPAVGSRRAHLSPAKGSSGPPVGTAPQPGTRVAGTMYLSADAEAL